jgi:secreted trypsin-like serine protease
MPSKKNNELNSLKKKRINNCFSSKKGDSGGPLVVQHTGSDSNPDGVAQGRWFKSGITSWGYGCGDGGVYARTSQYYQWIKDQITNN